MSTPNAKRTTTHPTAEQILSVYDYDRERGLFLRKTSFRQWQPGQVAGKVSEKGRSLLLPIFGSAKRSVSFAASKLVWFLETGNWPYKGVCHLDDDKNNDSFANLLAVPDDATTVSPSDLYKMFEYFPETGKLIRRFSYKGGRKGTEGTLWNNGYIMMHIGAVPIGVHRIAWRMVHGVWPDQIDHINGVRDDNRLCNLRNVSRQENARNVRKKSGSETGVMGVYKNSRGLPYRVRIAHNGKNLSLGSFGTIEEATAAREAAKIKYGYHENHGNR